MINSETIKLAGLDRDVTVKEIRVRHMLKKLPFLSGLLGEEGAADTSAPPPSATAMGEELLRDCCGLTRGEFLDLYPSDIEKLWEAFKRVNGFFFKSVANLGVGEQLRKLLGSILDGVGEPLVASLKEDMRGALTTASPGSSPPLKNPSDYVESD